MRLPPDPAGHGGSQRAWRLLNALRRIAPVHFVLIYRKLDKDAVGADLGPLETLCASVTRIEIAEWAPLKDRGGLIARLPYRLLVWLDLLAFRSHEAPRLSRRQQTRITRQLPVDEVDILFAGRLPSAWIMEGLMARGLLKAKRKVCDFDDVMSRFREREITAKADTLTLPWRTLGRIDAKTIRRAEAAICTTWDAVSLCTDEDVALVESLSRHARVVKAPNVVDRPLLPPRPPTDAFELLFVGNLHFAPNAQGLRLFLDEAWPKVLVGCPTARLTVVGMFPPEALLDELARLGVAVHANVPSVQPYYEACDAVVCPITFGGGTRIKILEAMAFGRPVVSTSIGAEGLHIESGRHALIADDMAGFADALLALAADPALRSRLAAAARELQQANFGEAALAQAVQRMVEPETP